MNANRLLLTAAFAALTVACGSSSHGHMDHDGTHHCAANIGADTVSYTIDGDQLTLSSPSEPEDLNLTRDGSGDDLFDSWAAPLQSGDYGDLQLYFVFDKQKMHVRSVCMFPDGVTLTAEAVSRAVYTDSTIETLDDSHAEKNQ